MRSFGHSSISNLSANAQAALMILLALVVAALTQPQLINLTISSFNITIGSGTPMYGILLEPNSTYVTMVNGPGLLYVLANSSIVIKVQGKDLLINGYAFVSIGVGEREVNIINNHNYSAYVFYMYQHNQSGGIPYTHNPIGLADYGIALYYGEPLLTYSYTTNEALGVVAIRSLRAFDLGNGCGVNVSDDYVDIQLNAIMRAGGGYYLLQDVAMLNGTGLTIIDNVWNMTSQNATLRGIYGLGTTGSFNGEQYYAYSEYVAPFKPPINLTLAIAVSGLGSAHVGFGYSAGSGLIWFDNVTIAGVGEPRLIVNGSGYVKLGIPIDLELVITGPVCGMVALIKSANVSLTLLRSVNGSLYPVPYAWGIGTLTGETVANATASPTSGVTVDVSSGAYEYPGPVYYYVPLLITTINGSRSLMVPRGYVLKLTLGEPLVNGDLMVKPVGYVVNGTLTVHVNNSSLVINGPTIIKEAYDVLYRVTLIGVKGNETPTVQWYPMGYVIRLSEPRYMGPLAFNGYLINNRTLVSAPSINVTINGPLTIKVLWGSVINVYALTALYVAPPIISLVIVIVNLLTVNGLLKGRGDMQRG
jgi:hypothetical protein